MTRLISLVISVLLAAGVLLTFEFSQAVSFNTDIKSDTNVAQIESISDYSSLKSDRKRLRRQLRKRRCRLARVGTIAAQKACVKQFLLIIDADTDGVRDHTVKGILVAKDNCPDVANNDQADADDDGTGDACEDVDPSV